jgi:tRNA threonylcarbamoyladenosine biosynthesis protein TsaE
LVREAPETLRIVSYSPEETQDLGRAVGRQARTGDIYLLHGPLGSGKTCLTQGIAWGLDVVEYARSPTFVLMNQYRGRLEIHHLDLYRVSSPSEAWDLGLEEQLFGNGICIVEWAERAEELFPEDSLRISLEYGKGDSDRVIVLAGSGSRFRPLLKDLEQLFPTTQEVWP